MNRTFTSLLVAGGLAMTDRKRVHDLKPVAGAVYGLAGAGAVALIVGLAAFATPRPAGALPSYAQQTGLACGRCHVNPAGGGARTAFGNAFAANGHKVPSKGTKPGKKSEGAPSAPSGTAPPSSTPAGAASAQSLRGTAATFWTTAPGVSNHSATPECDNCGVFVGR
jgi:hypothetical protein